MQINGSFFAEIPDNPENSDRYAHPEWRGIVTDCNENVEYLPLCHFYYEKVIKNLCISKKSSTFAASLLLLKRIQKNI